MLYNKFASWPCNLLGYKLHASLANDRNTSCQFNFIENVEFAHNMGMSIGLPLLSEQSLSTRTQLVVCLAWLSFLFSFPLFGEKGGGRMGFWPSTHPMWKPLLNLKLVHFGVKSIESKGLGISPKWPILVRWGCTGGGEETCIERMKDNLKNFTTFWLRFGLVKFYLAVFFCLNTWCYLLPNRSWDAG